MFSQGQLIFAVLFVIVFVALMIYSYRKDKQVYAKFYKNTSVVLVFFFLFVALLFGIKTFLKH